jgi:hypothetical protein
MKYLFSPNLSCATDRKCLKNLKTNYIIFTDFRIELNGIDNNLLSIYFNLPHTTNIIEEIKYFRNINDIFTNSINNRSIKLSLSNLSSSNY